MHSPSSSSFRAGAVSFLPDPLILPYELQGLAPRGSTAVPQRHDLHPN
ncbi:hypothetical protein HMPREF1556_00220 [Porphyromonas sp. oral taxon 278 str. W7784]|nr:hypothetical protein HMPREF1556_00220 [Porphyromonas sp. oral taxon 278 str. W7784]